MSRQSVEIVRASWAAYAVGDYEASLGAYADNTVWDDTRYRPDGAVHVGHGALVDVVRTWRGAWERYDIEVEDVLDAGEDRVALVLRETGEGKGGGVQLTNRSGLVATVRDRKIVHTMVLGARSSTAPARRGETIGAPAVRSRLPLPRDSGSGSGPIGHGTTELALRPLTNRG